MLAAASPMMPPPMADRSAAFWQFVATREVPDLGSGPRRGVMPLRDLEASLDLWAARHDVPAAAALRAKATALLYHDHHDEAHDIVQDLTDADAALLHGIVHRREPDYWNARYWFRRFDAHPVYLALGRRLPALPQAAAQAASVRVLTLPGAFDPFAFIDLCEASERLPGLDAQVLWLREVQHAEFEEVVRHLVA